MNESLLLVEDDDAVADVLQLHLAQAGYGIQREADGLMRWRPLTASRLTWCCST